MQLAKTAAGQRQVEADVHRKAALKWAKATLAMPGGGKAHSAVSASRRRAAVIVASDRSRRYTTRLAKRPPQLASDLDAQHKLEAAEVVSGGAVGGAKARELEGRQPTAGMRTGSRWSKFLWHSTGQEGVLGEVRSNESATVTLQRRGDMRAKVQSAAARVSALGGQLTASERLLLETSRVLQVPSPVGNAAQAVKGDKVRASVWRATAPPQLPATSAAQRRATAITRERKEASAYYEAQKARRRLLMARDRRLPAGKGTPSSHANVPTLPRLDSEADYPPPQAGLYARPGVGGGSVPFYDPDGGPCVRAMGEIREGDTAVSGVPDYARPQRPEQVSAGDALHFVEYCRPKPRCSRAIAWSSMGPKDTQHLLAVANGDMTLTFWGTRRFEARGHVHLLMAVHVMAWSDSANALFIAHPNSPIISVWDVLQREKLCELALHAEDVSCFADVPRHSLMAVGGLDSNVHLLKYADDRLPVVPKLSHSFCKHLEAVRFMKALPNRDLVVSGGGTEGLWLWDPASCVALLQVVPGRSRLVAVDVLGQVAPQVVTLDESGLFKVWNVADTTAGTATQTGCFRANAPPFSIRNFVVQEPHGTLVAAGLKHHLLVPVAQTAADPYPVAVQFSRELNILIVAAGSSINIYDASSGNLLRAVDAVTPDLIVSMCLDNRQRKLFVGDADGNIVVLNAFSGYLLKAPRQGHSDDVVSMCHAGGDAVVLSASWDRSLRIWSDSKPDEMPQLRSIVNSHDADMSSVCLLHPFSVMCSADVSGSIRMWDFCSLHLHHEVKCGGEVSVLKGPQPQENLPILFSADGSGGLSIFITPHVPGSGRLFLRVVNEGSRGGAPPPPLQPGQPAQRPFCQPSTVPVPILAMDVLVAGFTGEHMVMCADKSTLPASHGHLYGAPGSSAQQILNSAQAAASQNLPRAWIVTGDAQGMIKWWDLTDAVVRGPCSPVPPSQCPASQAGYDPHLLRRRVLQSTAPAAYDPSLDKKALRQRQAEAWLGAKATRPVSPSVPVATGERLRVPEVLLSSSISDLDARHPAWFSLKVGAEYPGFSPVLPGRQVSAQAWADSRVLPGAAPVAAWTAHSGSILSLSFIHTSLVPDIASTSQDLSVRLWSIVGAPLAVLCERVHHDLPEAESITGNPGGIKPLSKAQCPWSFDPSLATLLQARRSEAQEVMRELRSSTSSIDSLATGVQEGQDERVSGASAVLAVNRSVSQSQPDRTSRAANQQSTRAACDAVCAGRHTPGEAAEACFKDPPRPTPVARPLPCVGQEPSPKGTGAGSMSLHRLTLDDHGGILTELERQRDSWPGDHKVVGESNVARALEVAGQRAVERKAHLLESERQAAASEAALLRSTTDSEQRKLIDLNLSSNGDDTETLSAKSAESQARFPAAFEGLERPSFLEQLSAEAGKHRHARMPRSLVGKYKNFGLVAKAHQVQLRRRTKVASLDRAEPDSLRPSVLSRQEVQMSSPQRKPSSAPVASSSNLRRKPTGGGHHERTGPSKQEGSRQRARARLRPRSAHPKMQGQTWTSSGQKSVTSQAPLLKLSLGGGPRHATGESSERAMRPSSARLARQEEARLCALLAASKSRQQRGFAHPSDCSGHAASTSPSPQAAWQDERSSSRPGGKPALEASELCALRQDTVDKHKDMSTVLEPKSRKASAVQRSALSRRSASEQAQLRLARTTASSFSQPHAFGGHDRDRVLALKRMFDEIDTDGSGAVDLEEYMASDMFSGLLPTVAKSLFKAVDADGSGELELEELLAVAFPGSPADVIQEMLQYCRSVDQRKAGATRRAVHLLRLHALGKLVDSKVKKAAP